MAEGVYGIDPSGRCTFSNPSCARMLGYDSVDALSGQVMHAFIPHAAGDGDPCTPASCPLHAAHASDGELHSDALLLTRADGGTFPAECWSRPLRVGDRTVGAVVTFVDIAERKRGEEEILTAARRREEFLAMLSHELRNPLAAVLSATKVLGLPALEPPKIERARQVVQRQAKHMARLLDDLLDVARITRGSIGLRRKVIDLRECAQTAIEALKPQFEAHGTQLEVQLPSAPVYVEGDPDRLQQVHANLLGNASVYSPNGSRVRLELAREDGFAVCRVKDEGIGIEPELLPHVFELFVQGAQRLDRPRGGLGIGLTLVQTIVRLHGGSVEAKSEGTGKGSELIVRLPLTDAPSVAVSEGPAKANAKTSVLLIEDNQDAREQLKTLLENSGYDITEASDCASGLAALETVRPQVAIVDIGLPGIDGYQVAREIRRRTEHRDTYLIALTGYGQDSDVAQAREAGFDQHLTKPVDLEVLERLLSKH
jgi:two-component system CheB/CheR fusion protein